MQAQGMELYKQKSLPPRPVEVNKMAFVVPADSAKLESTTAASNHQTVAGKTKGPVLSSKSSMQFGEEPPIIKGQYLAPTDGSRPLSPFGDDRKYSQTSLQTRVGSMTKRLSALNLVSRGSKERVRGVGTPVERLRE